MKNKAPWLIAGVAVVLLIVGGYLNTQHSIPNVPSAIGLTGDPDTIKRCLELIDACNVARAELSDCSKFMHAITLGAWCHSEIVDAEAICRSAVEVCELAQ